MRYVLLAALMGLLVFCEPARARPQVGEVAPDFTIRLLDGSKRKLADYRGKVLVINYWATWCGPCKAEMPMMDEFRRIYSKYGFEILGVLTRDRISKRKLRPLAGAISYPLATWRSGRYGLVKDSLPTTYVIGRKGKVRS